MAILEMERNLSETIALSPRARLSYMSNQRGMEFDIFLEEPNHEDADFCFRCGEALSALTPDGFLWYGLYCPFPNEQPILDRLTLQGREHRSCNKNLIFTLQDLAHDLKEFSGSSLLYFDVSMYLACVRADIQALECPPRFHLWNDAWKWFSRVSPYEMCGMISRDHPGCLVSAIRDFQKEKVIEAFRQVFSDF